MSRVSLTLFAFLFLLSGCDRAATDAAQEQGALAGEKTSLAGEVDRSNAGDLMPAVTVTDPDGRELNLAAVQGQPVLMNLWATWCAPCIKEMPLLDELAVERADGLRVLTVSQDMQGAEKVVPFFAERDFEMLEPWLDPDNTLGFHFQAGLPMTVLYDASGREVWRIAGDYDWTSAEAAGFIDEGLD
ncbi:hypothetical protein GCM10022213_26070 [Parerythrobacter jejuensis]